MLNLLNVKQEVQAILFSPITTYIQNRRQDVR